MKSRSLKRIAAGLTAGVAAVALSGCGGAAPETVAPTITEGPIEGSVSIWGGANLTSAAEVVLEGFSKEIPEVDLSYEKFPFTEYPTKMRLQLSSNADTPDVMIVHDFLVGSFIEAGWLADLSKLVDADAYLPGSLDNVTKDDKFFGIPGQSNPTGFSYRADIFKELGLDAPETWDDYVATAKALKDAGYYIDTFDPNTAFNTFQVYLYQSGGAIFDEDGEIALGDEAEEALTNLKDMVDDGYFFTAKPNEADYWTAVNAGKIVGRLAASSDAAYLASNLDPNGAGGFGQWKYANPPQIDGGPATYLYDQSFVVVNAKSKNLSAAVAVAEYLTSNPDAALAYDDIERDGIVVRQTPSDVEALKAVQSDAAGWAVYGDQAVNATKADLLLSTDLGTVHKDSRWTASEEAISLILPQVFSGALTPAAAVEQMATQLQSIR